MLIKDYIDNLYYISNWDHWYKTFNKGVYVQDDFGNLVSV